MPGVPGFLRRPSVDDDEVVEMGDAAPAPEGDVEDVDIDAAEEPTASNKPTNDARPPDPTNAAVDAALKNNVPGQPAVPTNVQPIEILERTQVTVRFQRPCNGYDEVCYLGTDPENPNKQVIVTGPGVQKCHMAIAGWKPEDYAIRVFHTVYKANTALQPSDTSWYRCKSGDVLQLGNTEVTLHILEPKEDMRHEATQTGLGPAPAAPAADDFLPPDVVFMPPPASGDPARIPIPETWMTRAPAPAFQAPPLWPTPSPLPPPSRRITPEEDQRMRDAHDVVAHSSRGHADPGSAAVPPGASPPQAQPQPPTATPKAKPSKGGSMNKPAYFFACLCLCGFGATAWAHTVTLPHARKVVTAAEKARAAEAQAKTEAETRVSLAYDAKYDAEVKAAAAATEKTKAAEALKKANADAAQIKVDRDYYFAEAKRLRTICIGVADVTPKFFEAKTGQKDPKRYTPKTDDDTANKPSVECKGAEAVLNKDGTTYDATACQLCWPAVEG